MSTEDKLQRLITLLLADQEADQSELATKLAASDRQRDYIDKMLTERTEERDRLEASIALMDKNFRILQDERNTLRQENIDLRYRDHDPDAEMVGIIRKITDAAGQSGIPFLDDAVSHIVKERDQLITALENDNKRIGELQAQILKSDTKRDELQEMLTVCKQEQAEWEKKINADKNDALTDMEMWRRLYHQAQSCVVHFEGCYPSTEIPASKTSYSLPKCPPPEHQVEPPAFPEYKRILQERDAAETIVKSQEISIRVFGKYLTAGKVRVLALEEALREAKIEPPKPGWTVTFLDCAVETHNARIDAALKQSVETFAPKVGHNDYWEDLVDEMGTILGSQGGEGIDDTAKRVVAERDRLRADIAAAEQRAKQSYDDRIAGEKAFREEIARLRHSAGVQVAAEQEHIAAHTATKVRLGRAVDLLKWLNRGGGLGLDVHQRIDAILADDESKDAGEAWRTAIDALENIAEVQCDDQAAANVHDVVTIARNALDALAKVNARREGSK